MIKVCENCSSEFEGAAQARFCSDACRKAFARRDVIEVLSEEEEQAIRDRFGYFASETRTRRQRSDAAARMLGLDPEIYWGRVA